MDADPDQSSGRPDPDPVEELEQEMEADLAKMEERKGELDEDAEQAKADWESNRRDGSVPGALPPEDDEDQDKDEESAGRS
ncbi:MAG: hypothetical protein ABR536_05840 [Solirubrobacterales bacterium]